MRLLSFRQIIAFYFSFLLTGICFSQQTDSIIVFSDTSRKDSVIHVKKGKSTFMGQLIKVEELKREMSQMKREFIKQKTIFNNTDSLRRREIAAKNRSLIALNNDIAEKEKIIKNINDDMGSLRMSFLESKETVSEQKKYIEQLKEVLKEHDIEIIEIDLEAKNLAKNLSAAQLLLKRNKRLMQFLAIMLAMSVFLGISIYKNFKIKKRANQLLEEKNEEILQQNEEIRAQRDEIEKQHALVTEQRDKIVIQNKEITDSIVYARRIQTALLPHKDTIKTDIEDSFILFMPRNIVSGDYYWMGKKDGLVIIVAADCTGHGVPGAFMSMLGMAFLNEIVNQKGIIYANEVLNQLREYVIKALKQRGAAEDSKDGMDMSICIIDCEKMLMQFAGAYNPIYLIRNNELQEIEADKMPVSFFFKGHLSFTNKLIPLEDGDCIYMTSDGYCDQFGGPDDKKFSYKRFRHLLLDMHQKPFREQHNILQKTIVNWKGSSEQTDDILVVGIKV